MVEAREEAVVSLVQGLETEKIRCRSGGGGGPFPLPRFCWSIVCERVDGAFPNFRLVAYHIMLRNGGGEFQV
jgi:hypothetical protein